MACTANSLRRRALEVAWALQHGDAPRADASMHFCNTFSQGVQHAVPRTQLHWQQLLRTQLLPDRRASPSFLRTVAAMERLLFLVAFRGVRFVVRGKAGGEMHDYDGGALWCS